MAPTLSTIFSLLDDAYRDQKWHWSAPHVRAPFDVFAGAVLVQHTTWRNAERALEALRASDALDPAVLAAMPEDASAALVRISGTPSVKARRLRALAQTVMDAGGLDAMIALPTDQLRARLLATHGIGPESADAIALYAAGARVFVIDAYTRRLFGRIGLGPSRDSYEAWQRWLENAQPDATAADFARQHAHIVLHAKAVCRPRPRCDACVLRDACATGITALAEASGAATPAPPARPSAAGSRPTAPVSRRSRS